MPKENQSRTCKERRAVCRRFSLAPRARVITLRDGKVERDEHRKASAERAPTAGTGKVDIS